MAFLNSIRNLFRSPEVRIYFDKADAVERGGFHSEPKRLHTPWFHPKEPVSGRVVISVDPDVDEYRYTGVTVALVAQVSNMFGAGDFALTSQRQILDVAGTFTRNSEPKIYDFCFPEPALHFTDFQGTTLKVEHVIRVVMSRKGMAPDIVQTRNIFSLIVDAPPSPQSTQVEVGVDSCMKLDIKLDSFKLPLNGNVTGSVHFDFMKLKCSRMDLQVLRQEILKLPSTAVTYDTTTRAPFDRIVDTTTLGAGFTIMDGYPAEGDTIPIRLPLSRFPVSETVLTTRFEIRFFINVVLYDEDLRKYFKTIELELYRTENPYETEEVRG